MIHKPLVMAWQAFGVCGHVCPQHIIENARQVLHLIAHKFDYKLSERPPGTKNHEWYHQHHSNHSLQVAKSVVSYMDVRWFNDFEDDCSAYGHTNVSMTIFLTLSPTKYINVEYHARRDYMGHWRQNDELSMTIYHYVLKDGKHR